MCASVNAMSHIHGARRRRRQSYATGAEVSPPRSPPPRVDSSIAHCLRRRCSPRSAARSYRRRHARPSVVAAHVRSSASPSPVRQSGVLLWPGPPSSTERCCSHLAMSRCSHTPTDAAPPIDASLPAQPGRAPSRRRPPGQLVVHHVLHRRQRPSSSSTTAAGSARSACSSPSSTDDHRRRRARRLGEFLPARASSHRRSLPCSMGFDRTSVRPVHQRVLSRLCAHV